MDIKQLFREYAGEVDMLVMNYEMFEKLVN